MQCAILWRAERTGERLRRPVERRRCVLWRAERTGNAGGDDQWNADDVGCGDLRYDPNTLMNITSFLTNKIKPLSQQTCNMGRSQTLVLDATTCCSSDIRCLAQLYPHFDRRRDPTLEEEIRWYQLLATATPMGWMVDPMVMEGKERSYFLERIHAVIRAPPINPLIDWYNILIYFLWKEFILLNL